MDVWLSKNIVKKLGFNGSFKWVMSYPYHRSHSPMNWNIAKNIKKLITPQKTSIEPEKGPLEKEKHLQATNFGVPG